jgi:site-specific DNA-cytosine methylase
MDLKTTNTQKKEYVGNSNKSINIISMCSGIRGIERGLARALGHEPNTIIYVEIEAFIVANLIAGMEAGVLDPAPIWTDLKTFDGTPFCGKVHGIVAGWPCQPFSVAGKQKGVEDPRHLWPYIAKCIKATNPFFIFGENVPGHLNIGFREVKSELEEMGYRVEAGIYSAQEVGAPHKRDRLFILAIRFGVGLADPEMPKCKQSGNSWSTPTIQEVEHPNMELTETGRRKTKDGKNSHSIGLADQVKNWPTPDCSDRRSMKSKQQWLSNLVKAWPTPRASEWKGTGPKGSPSQKYRLDKKYLDATVEEIDGQQDPEKINTIGKNREQADTLIAYQKLYDHCGVQAGRILRKCWEKKYGKKLTLESKQSLNALWTLQLMGTTLEKTFFVPLVTQLWSKPLNWHL